MCQKVNLWKIPNPEIWSILWGRLGWIVLLSIAEVANDPSVMTYCTIQCSRGRNDPFWILLIFWGDIYHLVLHASIGPKTIQQKLYSPKHNTARKDRLTGKHLPSAQVVSPKNGGKHLDPMKLGKVKQPNSVSRICSSRVCCGFETAGDEVKLRN